MDVYQPSPAPLRDEFMVDEKACLPRTTCVPNLLEQNKQCADSRGTVYSVPHKLEPKHSRNNYRGKLERSLLFGRDATDS
jgi:hypothetical protein